jgi:hypothetical protein
MVGGLEVGKRDFVRLELKSMRIAEVGIAYRKKLKYP